MVAGTGQGAEVHVVSLLYGEQEFCGMVEV